jgi:hypothetical protein
MRSRKQSDSPSDATRDVYPLRKPPADPEGQDYFAMMRAVRDARLRYWALPNVVHTDDPRTALGRVAGAVQVFRAEVDSHEQAVQLAALALSLVAVTERAEAADHTTGGEAA